MRAKKIFTYLLLVSCLCTGVIEAQNVTVVDLSTRVGPITAEQLIQASVVNTSPESITGSVRAQITDDNGVVVATLESLPFSISPGQQVAPFDIPWIRRATYGTSVHAATFAREGLLTFGEFVLCFEFVEQQGAVLGTSCTERDPRPLLNFSLIFPADEQTISDNRPLLTWENLTPLGFSRKALSYSLVLVKVSKGQTSAEALERNIPLLRLNQLSQNTLLYPASAPELEAGARYAWTVRAFSAGQQLVSAQQWSFTLATPEIVADDPPSANSFVMLQTKITSSYQVFTDHLLIGFDNNEGVTDLDYKITRISGGNKSLKRTPKVDPLHPGLNTIAIPLEGLGLVEGGLYLLEVQTPRGQSYFLKFRKASAKG